MPVKFIDRFTVGFQVIVEAKEYFLLGGCTVSDNVVCDTFFEALAYMNAVIEDNVRADRSVRIGKVLEFEAWSPRRFLYPTAGAGSRETAQPVPRV